MEQLFPFLVSNLFLVVFYGIYYFFLKNETFHQANRIYLLSSTFLAVFIPWIDIPTIYAWFLPLKDEVIYEAITMDAVQITLQKPQIGISMFFIKNTYLFVSYFLIAITIFRLIKAFRLFSNLTFLKNNAFSFLGKKHIDMHLLAFETLEEHENTHIKQGHFFDLVFFEIIKALFWINPASYGLNRQIRILHEYLADSNASETMESKYHYSLLLMARHFGVESNNPFIQSFFKKSTIKHRITMLAKDPSRDSAQIKYFIAVPVLFILFISSSFTWLKNFPEKVSSITIQMDPKSFSPREKRISFPSEREENLIIADTTKPENLKINGEIFTAVEEQPEFPGGQATMFRYLGENIVYPKAAQRANISGRVFVRFIVGNDGTVSNVEILKGIGFGCDEEAKRVIEMMPKWTPGKQNGKAVNVYYNMPVVYKLDGEKNITTPNTEITSNHIPHTPKEKPLEIRVANKDYENALIIVNGVEILDRKINDIEPSSIERVDILKGPQAILVYGEKAKNGVILIKTKTM